MNEHSANSFDNFTRTIGWLILIFFWFGLYGANDWLENSEIPELIQMAILVLVGVGAFAATIQIHEKFDILFDKK